MEISALRRPGRAGDAGPVDLGAGVRSIVRSRLPSAELALPEQPVIVEGERATP